VSYDVFLQRYRDGDVVSVESSEVWRLLEESWDSLPDEFDHCRVTPGRNDAVLVGSGEEFVRAIVHA
jgi:hypothetical protein